MISKSGGITMKREKQIQLNKASPEKIQRRLCIIINFIGTLLLFGMTIYGIVTFAQIVHQSTNPTHWETEDNQERIASATSYSISCNLPS